MLKPDTVYGALINWTEAKGYELIFYKPDEKYREIDEWLAEGRDFVELDVQTIYISNKKMVDDNGKCHITNEDIFILLHEIGHLETNTSGEDTFTHEFQANTWAISKLKKYKISIGAQEKFIDDFYHFASNKSRLYNFENYWLDWDGVPIEEGDDDFVEETFLLQVYMRESGIYLAIDPDMTDGCVIDEDLKEIYVSRQDYDKLPLPILWQILEYYARVLGCDQSYSGTWANKMIDRHFKRFY